MNAHRSIPFNTRCTNVCKHCDKCTTVYLNVQVLNGDINTLLLSDFHGYQVQINAHRSIPYLTIRCVLGFYYEGDEYINVYNFGFDRIRNYIIYVRSRIINSGPGSEVREYVFRGYYTGVVSRDDASQTRGL